MTRRPFDVAALRRLLRYIVRYIHKGAQASRLPSDLVELLRSSNEYPYLTYVERALEIEDAIRRCIKLLSERYSDDESERRNYIKAVELILKLTTTSTRYTLTIRRQQAARLLNMSASTVRRSFEDAMLDDLVIAIYQLHNDSVPGSTPPVST